MSYNLKSSLEKAFGYVSVIAKEPVILKFDDKEIILNNQVSRDNIKISDFYFRDYSCMNFPGCVICCSKVKFWNIFTMKQHEAIKKDGIELTGEIKEISINSKESKIYVEDHTVKECPHMIDGCRVHLDNPIHCMLPLVKFKERNVKLCITKEVFGRNWQFGCPINVSVFEPIKPENYYYRCIRPLDKVKEFAEQFNVDTHIDYIIDLVNLRYSEWKSKSVRGVHNSLDNLF